MMGYVAMLIAATYCCDLALATAGAAHGTNPDGSHPGGALVQNPHHRMRWLVTRAVHHDDAGQGEGCEGGKCELRAGARHG